MFVEGGHAKLGVWKSSNYGDKWVKTVSTTLNCVWWKYVNNPTSVTFCRLHTHSFSLHPEKKQQKLQSFLRHQLFWDKFTGKDDLKVHSHVTFALAFFFGLCRPVLQNAKIKCEHHHLLLLIPFLIFDANPNSDAKCEQGFNRSIFCSFKKLVIKNC